jgi:ribonuclease E
MPPDSSRPLSGEPPTPPAPARWFTHGSHAARSPAPEPVTVEKEPDTQPEPTVAGQPAHQDESHAPPVAAPTEQMETNGPPEQSVPAKETAPKRTPAKETAPKRTPAKETAAKRTPAKRTAPRKTTARASSARRSRRPPPSDTPPSAR